MKAILKIPPSRAILLLSARIGAIKTLEENPQGMGYYDIIGWCSKTWAAVDEIFPADDRHPGEIRLIGTPTCSCGSPADARRLLEEYQARLLVYIDEIESGMVMK